MLYHLSRADERRFCIRSSSVCGERGTKGLCRWVGLFVDSARLIIRPRDWRMQSKSERIAMRRRKALSQDVISLGNG